MSDYREAGIKCDEHIEAFSLADLAHHEPIRTHPQSLLNQPTQGNFPFALQIRLPALQPHDVP